MKFNIQGIVHSPAMDQFQADWIGLTIKENEIILGVGKISKAQMLVINIFCGNDKPYEKADDMVITTIGGAQPEMEALFRARGRALAQLFQDQLGVAKSCISDPAP